VALVPFGAIAAVVYAVSGGPLWRVVALLAFVVGALGAWASVETGESIYEEVEGTPVVETFVEQHETYGEWTLWTSAVTALLLAGTVVWNRRTGHDTETRDPLAVRLVVLVFAVAAAVLVALAGHLGGLMVWGVPP
jgi:uncharacterized membrane protein